MPFRHRFEDRITQDLFLAALADGDDIRTACRRAGTSHGSLQRYAKANPKFANEYRMVIEMRLKRKAEGAKPRRGDVALYDDPGGMTANVYQYGKIDPAPRYTPGDGYLIDLPVHDIGDFVSWLERRESVQVVNIWLRDTRFQWVALLGSLPCGSNQQKTAD